PLDTEMTREIRLPLYYTGLTNTATIRINDGAPQKVTIERDFTAQVRVTIPADGVAWMTVE
ncbi:MAG: hypothetical protein WBW33_36575, partial [Bryobacteraceae bacterium]